MLSDGEHICWYHFQYYPEDRIKLTGVSFSQGGLKAVVWADVLQASIMAAGMVAIIVQGAINVGGFTNIFTIQRTARQDEPVQLQRGCVGEVTINTRKHLLRCN